LTKNAACELGEHGIRALRVRVAHRRRPPVLQPGQRRRRPLHDVAELLPGGSDVQPARLHGGADSGGRRCVRRARGPAG
ncbi:Os10g0103622, partial [Oryza sativa Japonica Group]